MISEPTANTDEAQVRALMDDWVAAVRAKDADRVMANYAADVIVFELTGTHSYTGAERYRQHMQGWFSAWEGPIHCEQKDLVLNVGSDVTFATCLTHNTGTGPGGHPMDFWVRATVGFRKIEGQWKAIHEHVSMPFDMETMKARMQPEG